MLSLYAMKDQKVDRACEDGRFSGATRGAAIGHVSPEAAAHGPIAIIQEGDTISIDINAGKINLMIDEAEMQKRMDAWVKPEAKIKEGWLYRYARLVTSADEGAVLK